MALSDISSGRNNSNYNGSAVGRIADIVNNNKQANTQAPNNPFVPTRAANPLEAAIHGLGNVGQTVADFNFIPGMNFQQANEERREAWADNQFDAKDVTTAAKSGIAFAGNLIPGMVGGLMQDPEKLYMAGTGNVIDNNGVQVDALTGQQQVAYGVDAGIDALGFIPGFGLEANFARAVGNVGKAAAKTAAVNAVENEIKTGVTKKLSQELTDKAAKAAFKENSVDKLSVPMQYGLAAADEAGQEYVQGIAGVYEEDPNLKLSEIGSKPVQDVAIESAVWGAIGGGAFKGVERGTQKLAKKVNEIQNKRAQNLQSKQAEDMAAMEQTGEMAPTPDYMTASDYRDHAGPIRLSKAVTDHMEEQHRKQSQNPLAMSTVAMHTDDTIMDETTLPAEQARQSIIKKDINSKELDEIVAQLYYDEGYKPETHELTPAQTKFKEKLYDAATQGQTPEGQSFKDFLNEQLEKEGGYFWLGNRPPYTNGGPYVTRITEFTDHPYQDISIEQQQTAGGDNDGDLWQSLIGTRYKGTTYASQTLTERLAFGENYGAHADGTRRYDWKDNGIGLTGTNTAVLNDKNVGLVNWSEEDVKEVLPEDDREFNIPSQGKAMNLQDILNMDEAGNEDFKAKKAVEAKELALEQWMSQYFRNVYVNKFPGNRSKASKYIHAMLKRLRSKTRYKRAARAAINDYAQVLQDKFNVENPYTDFTEGVGQVIQESNMGAVNTVAQASASMDNRMTTLDLGKDKVKGNPLFRGFFAMVQNIHMDSGVYVNGLPTRFNAQSSWTKWVQNIINMRNAEDQATSTFSAIIDANFRDKYIRSIMEAGIDLREATYLDTAYKHKKDLIQFAEKAWKDTITEAEHELSLSVDALSNRHIDINTIMPSKERKGIEVLARMYAQESIQDCYSPTFTKYKDDLGEGGYIPMKNVWMMGDAMSLAETVLDAKLDDDAKAFERELQNAYNIDQTYGFDDMAQNAVNLLKDSRKANIIVDAYKADFVASDLPYSEAAANKDIEDMHKAALDSIINIVGVDCASQWGLLSIDTAQGRAIWNKFIECDNVKQFKNLIFSLQISSIVNEHNNHMYLSEAVKAEDDKACKQALINSMASLSQCSNGNPIVHAFITMSFVNISGRYNFDNGFNYEAYFKAVNSLSDEDAINVAKGLLSAMNAFTDVSDTAHSYDTKVALLNNLYYGRDTDIPEISWMSWAAAGMYDEIEMSSFQNKIKKANASLKNKNTLTNITNARTEVKNLSEAAEQDNNEYSLQEFLLYRAKDIHIKTFKRANGLYQLYATMAQRVQADKGKVSPGADALYQHALMVSAGREYQTIADELTLSMSGSEMTAEAFQRNRYAMLHLICDPTYSIYVDGYGPEPLTMERFYKETAGIELNGLMPTNTQIASVLRRYPQLVSWMKDMSMVPTTSVNGGVTVSMLGDGSESLVESYNKYKTAYNSSEAEYLELEADRLIYDLASIPEVGAALTDLTGHEMTPNEMLYRLEEGNKKAADVIKWGGSALHNKTIQSSEELRDVISEAVYGNSFKHVLGLSGAFTYVSFDDRVAQTVNNAQRTAIKKIADNAAAKTVAEDLSERLGIKVSTEGTKYESKDEIEIDDISGFNVENLDPQKVLERIAYLTNPNYNPSTEENVEFDTNLKADLYQIYYDQALANMQAQLGNNATSQDLEDFKADFKQKFKDTIDNIVSQRKSLAAARNGKSFIISFEQYAKEDMFNAADVDAVEAHLSSMLDIITGVVGSYKSYTRFKEADVEAIYKAIQSSNEAEVLRLSKLVIGKSMLRHVTTRYGIEVNWEYEVEAEQIIDLIVEGAENFQKDLARLDKENKTAVGKNIATHYDISGINTDLSDLLSELNPMDPYKAANKAAVIDQLVNADQNLRSGIEGALPRTLMMLGFTTQTYCDNPEVIINLRAANAVVYDDNVKAALATANDDGINKSLKHVNIGDVIYLDKAKRAALQAAKDADPKLEIRGYIRDHYENCSCSSCRGHNPEFSAAVRMLMSHGQEARGFKTKKTFHAVSRILNGYELKHGKQPLQPSVRRKNLSWDTIYSIRKEYVKAYANLIDGQLRDYDEDEDIFKYELHNWNKDHSYSWADNFTPFVTLVYKNGDTICVTEEQARQLQVDNIDPRAASTGDYETYPAMNWDEVDYVTVRHVNHNTWFKHVSDYMYEKCWERGGIEEDIPNEEWIAWYKEAVNNWYNHRAYYTEAANADKSTRRSIVNLYDGIGWVSTTALPANFVINQDAVTELQLANNTGGHEVNRDFNDAEPVQHDGKQLPPPDVLEQHIDLCNNRSKRPIYGIETSKTHNRILYVVSDKNTYGEASRSQLHSDQSDKFYDGSTVYLDPLNKKVSQREMNKLIDKAISSNASITFPAYDSEYIRAALQSYAHNHGNFNTFDITEETITIDGISEAVLTVKAEALRGSRFSQYTSRAQMGIVRYPRPNYKFVVVSDFLPAGDGVIYIPDNAVDNLDFYDDSTWSIKVPTGYTVMSDDIKWMNTASEVEDLKEYLNKLKAGDKTVDNKIILDQAQELDMDRQAVYQAMLDYINNEGDFDKDQPSDILELKHVNQNSIMGIAVIGSKQGVKYYMPVYYGGSHYKHADEVSAMILPSGEISVYDKVYMPSLLRDGAQICKGYLTDVFNKGMMVAIKDRFTISIGDDVDIVPAAAVDARTIGSRLSDPTQLERQAPLFIHAFAVHNNGAKTLSLARYVSNGTSIDGDSLGKLFKDKIKEFGIGRVAKNLEPQDRAWVDVDQEFWNELRKHPDDYLEVPKDDKNRVAANFAELISVCMSAHVDPAFFFSPYYANGDFCNKIGDNWNTLFSKQRGFDADAMCAWYNFLDPEFCPPTCTAISAKEMAEGKMVDGKLIKYRISPADGLARIYHDQNGSNPDEPSGAREYIQRVIVSQHMPMNHVSERGAYNTSVGMGIGMESVAFMRGEKTNIQNIMNGMWMYQSISSPSNVAEMFKKNLLVFDGDDDMTQAALLKHLRDNFDAIVFKRPRMQYSKSTWHSDMALLNPYVAKTEESILAHNEANKHTFKIVDDDNKPISEKEELARISAAWGVPDISMKEVQALIRAITGWTLTEDDVKLRRFSPMPADLWNEAVGKVTDAIRSGSMRELLETRSHRWSYKDPIENVSSPRLATGYISPAYRDGLSKIKGLEYLTDPEQYSDKDVIDRYQEAIRDNQTYSWYGHGDTRRSHEHNLVWMKTKAFGKNPYDYMATIIDYTGRKARGTTEQAYMNLFSGYNTDIDVLQMKNLEEASAEVLDARLGAMDDKYKQIRPEGATRDVWLLKEQEQRGATAFFNQSVKLNQLTSMMSIGVPLANLIDGTKGREIQNLALMLGKKGYGPYVDENPVFSDAMMEQIADDPECAAYIQAYRISSIASNVADVVSLENWIEDGGKPSEWLKLMEKHGNSKMSRMASKAYSSIMSFGAAAKFGRGRLTRNYLQHLSRYMNQTNHPLAKRTTDAEGNEVSQLQVLLTNQSHPFEALHKLTNDYTYGITDISDKAMQLALRGDAAQNNAASILIDAFCEPKASRKFFRGCVLGMNFPRAATTINGRILNNLGIPTTTLNYIFSDFLGHNMELLDGMFKTGKTNPDGTPEIDVARRNFVQQQFLAARANGSLKEAFICDLSHMTLPMFGLCLAAMGLMQPPDDDRRKDDYEEWIFAPTGERIALNWWMKDIIGPILPLVCYWTTVLQGEPNLNILTNGAWDMFSGNAFLNNNQIINWILEPDSIFEDWEQDADYYSDNLTDVSFQEWLAGNATGMGLSWIGNIITPGFIKEISRNSYEFEKSYNLIYKEDETGQRLEGSETQATSYIDSRIRKITRNNALLGAVANMVLNPDGEGTGYQSWEMPNQVKYDTIQMAFMHENSIYNFDENGQRIGEKTDEEKTALCAQLLYTMISNDAEELYNDGWYLDYDTKVALSDYIWSIYQEEIDEWNARIDNKELDYYVLGDGDLEAGKQLYDESYNTHCKVLNTIKNEWYTKLWSKELNQGLIKYNRYNTTWKQDSEGNWYSSGIKQSLADIVLPWQSIAETEYENDASRSAAGGQPMMNTENEPDRALSAYIEPDNQEKPDWNKLGTGSTATYGRRGYGGGYGGGGYSRRSYGGGSNVTTYSAKTNQSYRTHTGSTMSPTAGIMNGRKMQSANLDYLRPNFETKGSRQAYKREDI